MIYIPFIYFSLLSLWTYTRHHAVDMATICSLMFAVSGFFSIVIDANNLRYWDSAKYEITPSAAITYCTLITLCILPMTRCDFMHNIHIRPMRHTRLIQCLAVVCLVWFLVTLCLGWGDLTRALTGDMHAMKNLTYKGISNVTWQDSLPTGVRLMISSMIIVFSSAWTLAFIGFYSMLSPELPFRYSCYFLIASLGGPVMAIENLDRSAVSYWIISVGVLFWIFRRHLSPTRRAKVNKILVGLVLVLCAYLVANTIQRFGQRVDHQGTEGSMISYLGQTYINFCCFFDTYQVPFHHFGILFPLTSLWVFGLPAGGVPIQEMMTQITGMRTGVFYTFIGHFIIALGQQWAIAITLLYASISWTVLNRIGHKVTKTVTTLYVYVAISSVVLLGLFTHYYAGSGRLLSVFLVYIIIKVLR